MGLIPLGGRSSPTYGIGAAAVEQQPGGDEDRGTAATAKAQAYLAGGAALVAFVGVVLPHPPEFSEIGLLATQAVTIAFAVIFFVLADRIPARLLAAMPAVATLLTTIAIVFTRDATSAYAMFYLWVALYAFFFLPARSAALQIGFAILCYAGTIVFVGGPESQPVHGELHHLVLVAGTLVVTAIPLVYLRNRSERLMRRLIESARTDLLTGLRNARGLHEALVGELERARIAGGSVSVLVCDLDRFKEVNERLGHRTGDELLKRIGTLFDEATRTIDTVARIGPQEFAIALPGADETQAYLTAEQLLGRVRRGFREEFMPLTTSIGIATFPNHAVTVEELLKLADQALLAAKVLGRDRAVVSSTEVPEVLSGITGRRPLESQAHLSTMLSLAEALDLRDSGTAKHATTVGRYAQIMARELGLPEQRVERVRLAGILHDIGKVGIPDAILCKMGPLDEAEWREMRRHPELGARILGTRELVDIREWVLASHERPDGQGYPRGLRGDQIPIEARILAVADAFEAMTSDRVYRPGMGEPAARDELEANAGTQFDPDVVAAFLRALDRERAAESAR
jgi:diguanylate cyclase (GGDEF)-like protein/putative nucleotidyltransferase with HDIG domain